MLPKGPFMFYSRSTADLDFIRDWIAERLDEDESAPSIISADGCCLVGVLQSNAAAYPAVLSSSSDGIQVGVIDGVLFDDCPWRSQPHVLAGRNNSRIGSETNGMFAGGAYTAGAITLLTDPWGTLPLYRMQSRSTFGAASSLELLAVWTRRVGSLRRDPAGISQLLSFGTILDGSTIFHGIRKMAAAEILRVYVEDNRTPQNDVYYTPTVVPQPYPGIEKDITESFRAAVHKVMKNGPGPVIATISGGMDSRVIAAVLAAENNPVRFFTHFTHEGHDLHIAQAVTAALNLDHEIFRLPVRFQLEDEADTFLSSTNSAVSLNNLHALHSYRHVGNSASSMIDGNHTSIEGRWFLRNTAHRVRDRESFFQNVRSVLLRGSLLAYVDDPGAYLAQADDCLRALIPDPDDFASAGCAADVFWVRHILPNHGTDLALMQNHFQRYLSPYLDREYVDVISRVPERKRWAQQPQYEILRRFAPQLMKLPRSYSDILTWATADPYLLRIPVAFERLYMKAGIMRYPRLYRKLSRHSPSVGYELIADPESIAARADSTPFARERILRELLLSGGRISSSEKLVHVLPHILNDSLTEFRLPQS